jgi:hypothetical protein
MKKLFALAITLAALIFTVGCVEQGQGCVRLPTGGQYCLQPTTALAAFDAQQIVEVSVRGHKETIVLEMESDPKGLRLVGLTPFGHKIIQIGYDNRATTVQTLPNTQLDPVLLVALLQITLWPADSVRKGLSPQFSLEEHGNIRRILYGKEAMLTINRIGTKLPYSKMHLVIPSAEIEIDIRSLNSPPTSGVEP